MEKVVNAAIILGIVAVLFLLLSVDCNVKENGERMDAMGQAMCYSYPQPIRSNCLGEFVSD